MRTLVIATRNAHKITEIRTILGDGFRYLALTDFSGSPEVVEDANSFAGNAIRKAAEIARWLAEAPRAGIPDQSRLSTWVLADDSGLEVDFLGGAPGVLSARFAASDGQAGNARDVDNNEKLLGLLKGLPWEGRTARFRCVVALAAVHGDGVARPGEAEVELFEGVCEGRIGFVPRGVGGFGYDPLFVPEGFDQTFAELGEETKNTLSHRARALAKLKKRLAGCLP